MVATNRTSDCDQGLRISKCIISIQCKHSMQTISTQSHLFSPIQLVRMFKYSSMCFSAWLGSLKSSQVVMIQFDMMAIQHYYHISLTAIMVSEKPSGSHTRQVRLASNMEGKVLVDIIYNMHPVNITTKEAWARWTTTSICHYWTGALSINRWGLMTPYGDIDPGQHCLI